MPEPEYDFARVYNLNRGRDIATTQTAIQGLDANPDDAARAVQLGTATGTPPSVVDLNLEKFERDQKTGIVGNILQRDRALRSVVEQDPIFAKVTADDWGQTARVSDAAHNYSFWQNRVISETAKGFMENYVEATREGEQKFTEEYEKATPYLRTLVAGGRMKMDFLSALFHGGLGAAAKGAAQIAREVGADENTAIRFGREAGAFLEYKTIEAGTRYPGFAKPHLPEAAQVRVAEAYKKAEPYLRAGKSVPDGLDPLLDQMKAIQAHWDRVGIDAILDEAEKSKVKERSPDMMVKLLQQHVGDRLVALPYDAVEKVYGSKAPQAGDGLFGDIPGFIQKYNDAVLTGGDILLPMAEYVGRITPEARNAIGEFFKPSPGGMTLFEAKSRLAEPIDLGEPAVPAKTLVESVKDSVGVEALMPEQIYSGLDKRTQERFIQLADRDRLEDLAWNVRKAAEEVAKTKTKQWTEESALMRPDVTLEVSNRPEWVAHDWFTGGVLRGVSGERPKVDPMKLTPEQRKAFPKEFMERRGADPEMIAQQAGFKTVDEMVDVMSRFYQEKGEVGPTEFLNGIVTNEVNRRMEAEYGSLPDQILSAAQDHILSKSTTSERAWENTVGISLHAGMEEPPYTKKGMEQAVKNTIAKRIIGELDRETFIRDAGKAARDMAKAFLKGDFTEALKQSQRHHAAVLAGKEVAKILREKEIFERQMQRFKRQEVPAFMNPFGYPYLPRIQSIMVRIGRAIEHTEQSLADALGQGEYGGLTLSEFVKEKKGELRDIDVPDFLLNERWEKPVEKMSVEEWRGVRDAISDLVENGRNEATIYREGKAYDLNEEIKGGVEQIKLRGVKKLPKSKAAKTWNKMKEIAVEHLNVESILNRIDEDDPSGFHNQFVMRMLVEGDNTKQRLTRYYNRALTQVAGDIKDIDKKVDNTLFINPSTKEPLDLRKRDVLGALMYWGSPSGKEKLLKGWNVPEDLVYQWLLKNTTKEDWDRAQQIGHIFNRLINLADRMRMEISGSPVKKIDLFPFDTPHGRYEGWYNPVDYSPFFPGRAQALTGEKILEGPGFSRATTSQGYALERTRYVGYVDLSLDAIPVRMREMIHDIAFRPAILQASKIFYNPEWRQAMINYYGPHFEKQFIPALKDIANYANHTEGGVQELLMERLRQNIISTYIGLNPHTVAKHGLTAAMNSVREVGAINFLGSLKDTLRPGSESWKFAMETSEELQKRMKSWTDFMGMRQEVALRNKSIRETLAGIGSTPVAFFDLYSAVPTWLAKYREAVGRGLDEGQAIFEADRAVRRAHGSSAITNLPKVMRTNSVGRMYTSLYGFFSHMYQKQFEIAWKAHDAYYGVKAGDYSKLAKYKGDIALGIVSYVIIPAIVEEIVTPYMNHEQDSWGKKAGKALFLTGTSSVPYVRDFARAVVNQIEPSAGMLQSAFHDAWKLQRDMTKGKYDYKTMANIIKEAFTTAGIAAGYTNAQEGRSLAFAYRWYHGLEKPKGLWDILSGLTRGTAQEPKHRRRH